MNNQMVTVNGTSGLLLNTTENEVVVQYGFGVVVHNKEDVMVEVTNKPIPKYLSGLSHEDVVQYARSSKKRSGPSKKDQCEAIFVELANEIVNGSVRPSDIKAMFMEQCGCSIAQASTYYYQLKKSTEESRGISLNAPKREKEESEITE